MRLSLSIEDTNRLRARVGLRLISTDVTPQADAASVPSQKVKQLQKRILDVEERAEERALHAVAVEGPAIVDTPAQSTSSWLEKMRQKRIASNLEAPDDKPLEQDSERYLQPVQPTIAHSKHTETPGHPSQISEEIPENRNALKLPRSANNNSHQPVSISDPIMAPAEPQHIHKRNHELDYEPNKKAIFKPKKLKTSSKTRTRSSETPVAVTQLEDEEDALQSLLTNSRVEHLNRKKTSVSENRFVYPAQPEIDDQNPSSTLSIGPTQTFLRELQNNTNSGDTDGAVELELDRPDKRDQRNNTQSDNIGGEQVNDEEIEEPAVTNSVADTLKLLKEEQNLASSSQSAIKSRREWIQRLTSTRLAKKADVAADMDALRHLPSHERQRAIELHKNEAALNDAKAAKELFKDYNPDVSVEHRDEYGNIIDSRQAFKRLSSAFHGTKGSKSVGRKRTLSPRR